MLKFLKFETDLIFIELHINDLYFLRIFNEKFNI